MYAASLLLPVLGAALVSAQGAPPPPVLLTMTKSGVLPVLPTATPFAGVETEEGAIIDQGPANPGFTGPGGNATAQANLPAATYTAVLPSTNFDNLTGSTVAGSITGVSSADGTGVTFTVNFTGFPNMAAYGPFLYHIHAMAVPANGNCSATMGHLDPTDRGEYYPCEVAAPQTCQAGDLAGKHGKITASPFVTTFTEPYLSTIPGSPYFFGDLSVVIHSANTTRLTCANFQVASASNATSPNATSPAQPSQTVEPYTGAASHATAGVAAIFAGVAALFMLS